MTETTIGEEVRTMWLGHPGSTTIDEQDPKRGNHQPDLRYSHQHGQGYRST